MTNTDYFIKKINDKYFNGKARVWKCSDNEIYVNYHPYLQKDNTQLYFCIYSYESITPTVKACYACKTIKDIGIVVPIDDNKSITKEQIEKKLQRRYELFVKQVIEKGKA